MLDINHLQKKIKYIIFLIFILLFSFSSLVLAEEVLSDNYVLKADDITFKKQQGLVIFTGDPSFESADFTVEADRIVADTNAKTVEAFNNVVIYSDKDNLYGDKLNYNYQTEKGKLYGAEGSLGALNFSGKVLNILSTQPLEAEMESAAFTPCVRDEPHYHYKAKEAHINPDNTMELYHIVPYVWKIPVFYLPYYSLTYDPSKEDQLRSTHPMPRIGYDSDRGMVVEFNYPYKINERNSGKINYLSEGFDYDRYERRTFTNNHRLTDRLTFKNRYDYLYDYDLDDEKLDDEYQEFFSSLEYSTGKYSLEAGLGKDLLADKKDEDRYLFTGRYRFNNGLNTSFRHEYNFDWERIEERYVMSYNQHPIKWNLKYIDGDDYNYYPYLTLRFPSVLGVSTTVGTGRVENGGVTLNKERLNLKYNFAQPLFGGFSYHLSYRYRLDHYRSDYNFNYYYTVFNHGLRYRKKLNSKINFNSSLFYQRNHPWGEQRSPLPDDREDEERLLKPGASLSYNLDLPQSSIALETDGEYNLDTEEWEKINLRLRRNEDCFTFFVGYEFIDESFTFGLEI